MIFIRRLIVRRRVNRNKDSRHEEHYQQFRDGGKGLSKFLKFKFCLKMATKLGDFYFLNRLVMSTDFSRLDRLGTPRIVTKIPMTL